MNEFIKQYTGPTPEQRMFVRMIDDLVESYVRDLNHAQTPDDVNVSRHRFLGQLGEMVMHYDKFRSQEIEGLKSQLLEVLSRSVWPMQIILPGEKT